MDSINNEKITCQKELYNIKKIYQLDTKGMVYDLTNTYFHGKQCPIGKLGLSKDGKRQNDLIQIALATTQKASHFFTKHFLEIPVRAEP